MKKKFLSLLLAASLLVQLAACAAPGGEASQAASSQPAASQPAQEQPAGPEAAPQIGEEIAGFTLTSVEPFAPPDANLLSFTHTVSGAQLLYIQNDDTNRAFAVAYRTPQVDETDTNHVFEHAVLASSGKYPSHDLFFDLMGKTYNTYLNAFTNLTFTIYPVASQSEEQLQKMADAYLSCMVDPSFLKDERFFQREALRYMLYDVDDPIQMGGTVFSEDTGRMTDISLNAMRNLLQALYPGEYAANMLGWAFENYEGLTYEHTVATYDRAYHFDNSLLLLYGDLDYQSFLAFLDREYLSHYPAQGTDLSAYDDPPTQPGYVEAALPIPAYEGSATRDVSYIFYAMDLDGADWTQLAEYDLLSSAFNMVGSPFRENLYNAGITSLGSAGVGIDSAKPFFAFMLQSANPEDAAPFKAVVEQTLAQVAEEGLDPALVESILKAKEIGDYTTLEQADVIIENIFPYVAYKWVQTGETDSLLDQNAAFDTLRQDTDQQLIRQLTANLQNAQRSALVTSTPQPGLAEQILQEQSDYLAEKKAGMTQAELEQLVADTLAFDEWNALQMQNEDLSIPVADLPLEEPLPQVTQRQEEGITYLTVPSGMEGIGSYAVYFDTSTIPQEDLYYLRLYLLLADQLGTKTHTATEMNQLAMQYLYGYTLGTKYPDSGAFANPFVYLQWYALPQDTEASLDLLLELFGQLDLNPEEVLYAIDQILPQSDLSRADEMDLAILLAQTVSGSSYQYAEMLSGQGFYEFLAQQRAQLDADPAAMDTLTAKLQEISGHILHRDNLVVMAAAPADTLDGFCALAGEKLGALPSLPKAQAAYAFPQYPDQFAVVTEGSTTTTAAVLDAKKLENLSGTLFPFLYALENQYLVPTIRFQGLAYSAGILVSSQLDQLSVYSYSDPNPAASVAAIAQIPDVLAELELTQEELDGYILSAYSLVTRPTGKLERMMMAMQYTLSGFDTGLQQRLAREMLEATPADKEAAVEAMRTLWEDMRLVTVGNAALIQAAAEVYDAVYDYRQG